MLKKDQQNSNIELILKNLPADPGVYIMKNAADEILYVGKARNLKKRVTSYFRKQSAVDIKTRVMIQQVTNIEFVAVQNETESLLLENNLIKKHRPRFNVLLRDDKSYPYLFLSDDEYPRLDFHRGPHTKKGEYFGPYPSAFSVRENLQILQKIFRIRQCNNHFFQNRSRPCLLYQIKRCSGPCVKLVNKQEYLDDVHSVRLFLRGKSQEVLTQLSQRMDVAAKDLNYEHAAKLRNQIVSLRKLQDEQDIVNTKINNADVLACAALHGVFAVQLLMIRDGRLLGNKPFFPKVPANSSETEVLTAFIGQYYLSGRAIPEIIIVNLAIPESAELSAGLSAQAGHKVKIVSNVRGERERLLALAEKNVNLALSGYLSTKLTTLKRFEDLQNVLGLPHMPMRLECYDISHTRGEATVASCVVFNQEGPYKTDYRRYNIKNITPGDDYAAMRQVLERRFKKIKEQNGILPDILFVDGGKGQLRLAEEVLTQYAITNVLLIGIAKGKERKPGMETLWLSSNEVLELDPTALAFHLIQQIRDEAHRFAISGHRAARKKARTTSPLENIEGVGPKRRRELLKHFGGWQKIKGASVEDLIKVPGISRKLAEQILQALR